MTKEYEIIYYIVENWGNAARSADDMPNRLKAYARVVAVEFDLWRNENEYRICNIDQRSYTTGELFDLFMEEKMK